MTPRELAEKIVAKGQEISDDGGSSRRMINWLESLLTEALAEAKHSEWVDVTRDCELHVKDIKETYEVRLKEARDAAYEECAKLVDSDHDCGDPYACHAGLQAEKLRRRAGELK